jgi:hypothetical protein
MGNIHDRVFSNYHFANRDAAWAGWSVGCVGVDFQTITDQLNPGDLFAGHR